MRKVRKKLRKRKWKRSRKRNRSHLTPTRWTSVVRSYRNLALTSRTKSNL